MKKLAASLALTAALALLPAQAASADILDLSAGVFPDDELAALSSSGDPFAVGGGTLGNPSGTHFAFSAHLGPNGPSGYAVVSDPVFGEAQGRVCRVGMFVISHEARFSIEVEKGSGTLGSFPFLVFGAADNEGEPPTGTLADFLVVAPGSVCGGGFIFLSSEVDQGNIVVK